MTITDGSGTGKGKQFNVTISVSDWEISGGEIVKIKYKIGFNGDPTDVSVTVTKGVITVGSSAKAG